ncbi:MAG: PD40 domain-containing protein [Phycisphaerae bacterium]|nr:PD40 domain-containing protein [Gemmatimonadaceae bacterium]
MQTGRRWASALAMSLSAAAFAPLGAQGYFGQNQVQYEHFKWRVLETDHFQIHYYPKIGEVMPDIAKMAERSYARLSVLMGHQFREKKPVLMFASSGDFAQSNTFGDLGEGTGGATDPLRQRMAQFITGDYASLEHVLQHEMVHVFQFDIFSRGRAGAGLGNFAQVNPPLWFMEGLAEYFSIGQKHAWTDAWIRDAVVNNTLPSILQMTERPDKYFPYRFGFSVWQYVGQRWGDEVIAEIMNSVPSIGIERSFRRELGLTTAQLSAEWKQAMQSKFLPVVATLDRPRSFAEPLLTQTRTGGDLTNLFVAPALSPDGQRIAYIAYGSLKRGEIFPDLYLANAVTGKREARLVKSANDPNFEQLRFIYSQSSFSPDGKSIAFTSQRGGRDILNLMDVRSRDVYKRIDFDLDQVLSPGWSPDGKTLVFAGLRNGVSDLYLVDADGTNFKQLTKDRYGDMQPQWSPDGKTIVFTSDRSPDTDFEILKIGKWKIQTLDVASGDITLVPNQGGLNVNPQWAPDGKTIIFVSDRNGTANLFLYDLAEKEHYQLTNVVGAITAIAEYSPAITWARGADVLAFVYYEKGDHTVWKVANPRALKKLPYREQITVAAQTPGTAGTTGTPAVTTPSRVGMPIAGVPGAHLPTASVQDTSATRRSVYRAPLQGARLSSELAPSLLPAIANSVSITAMMDSFNFNLPDSTRYRDRKYKVRLMPEYISQPQIGYQQGGFLQGGAYGGTTIVLTDLLNDHLLFISGSLNGAIADASLYVAFANLARRLQYITSLSTTPINYLSGQYYEPINDTQAYEVTELTRLVVRNLSLTTLYPVNRFTRFEVGARLDNIDQQVYGFSRPVDLQFGVGGDYTRLPNRNLASATNVSPSLAWVTDNTIPGQLFFSPLSGKRIRLSVAPTFGTWKYTDYLLDARRYLPILFNYITVAGRITANIATGQDAGRFPKWIGSPNNVRGYNREITTSGNCTGLPSDNGSGCSGNETIGSRVAFANLEVRFPVLRLLNSGLPIPPIEGLVFYDAGAAWNEGQKVSWNRGPNFNLETDRQFLKSYGFGLRANLFNIAIVRYDWAVPYSRPGQKGYGTFSLGLSY